MQTENYGMYSLNLAACARSVTSFETNDILFRSLTSSGTACGARFTAFINLRVIQFGSGGGVERRLEKGLEFPLLA